MMVTSRERPRQPITTVCDEGNLASHRQTIWACNAEAKTRLLATTAIIISRKQQKRGGWGEGM